MSKKESQQNTIKKLEKLKTDLYPWIESLDGTWSECTKCGRRTYSSRIESLVRVNLKNTIRQLNYDIEKLTTAIDTGVEAEIDD